MFRYKRKGRMMLVLFAVYVTGLLFWYKTEETESRKGVGMLQMDLDSLLSRVEMLESITQEIKNREEK